MKSNYNYKNSWNLNESELHPFRLLVRPPQHSYNGTSFKPPLASEAYLLTIFTHYYRQDSQQVQWLQ